jgi:phosphocarrier protein HPr
MIEKELKIVNKNGMHTRPAAQFVKIASKFLSTVTLARDGFVINGKSIIGVMTLAAEFGCVLVLNVDGEDEDQATLELTSLIENGFSEI